MYLIKAMLKLTLTILGIFLIGSLPYLFYNYDRQMTVLKMIDTQEINNTLFLHDTINFDFIAYCTHVLKSIKNILNFDELQYYFAGVHYQLFPELWGIYINSMYYLIIAICIGLGGSIFLLIIYYLSPLRTRSKIYNVAFIIESLPDIFIMFLLQTLIVLLYKKTNLMLFDIASSYGNRAVGLPIICLSILPTIFLFKYLVLSLEEEEKKLYVELAQGKGLGKLYVLIVHILRNNVLTLFNHFKTIFWFTLSNLFVLEIIFNVNGIMKFITKVGPMNPEVTSYIVLLIFIPYSLFIYSFQFLTYRLTGGGN
jgi:peptide/nickel transport system permease protein